MAEDKKSAEEKAQEKALDEKNKAAAKIAEEKKKHDEELEEKATKNQEESKVPKTDTVAKIDAATDEVLEQAKEDPKAHASGISGGINQPFATAEQWTYDDHGRRTNPNDVKFEVSYPASFAKDKRHMPEGITVVSREVAEQFEELGIGKIVK